MLNDLARQTRTMLFLQMLGPAIAIGSFFGIADEHWGVVLTLFCLGLLVTVGWGVGVLVWTRRVDRAFKTVLTSAGEQLVTGRVTGVPVPGRVVRRRTAAGRPAYLASTPSAIAGPAAVLVVTVLADDGPRRVGALVPATIGLEKRDAPVAVLLHPDEREAAVVDDRVTPEQVAAIAADPRWESAALPTDRTVGGGYLPMLGCALLGLASGLGLDLLVVALAT
ncbi:hypothetical protein [Nocardioides lijunqiniae]|uniref:hypothetical protein n=1 Tax=Nocardioides lijunqiniae TaxID=2760832 RepID=UPI0018784E2D|nr:hypothetical protein [Nocardioides lijunqiniae]